MIAECDHRPSRDPRHEGICVKCARPIPVVKPARDPHYERIFFDQLHSAVERRFGVDATGYINTVKARLTLGSERYGDDDFLSKDVVEALLEETPDLAAYALLETHKMLMDPLEDEGYAFWLFETAVAGAWADVCAKRAAAARQS